jgi:tetratricopeptide (TPR) repeat protein
MRKHIHWTLLLAMSMCAPMLIAATATDFYVELLRRGTAEVEAGRNETALTPLRLAAFGLVDNIEHYETAQAYLVVALDRMNQGEAAREAVLRIVAAERVERKFASLRLPEAIRAAFGSAAKKVLSPEVPQVDAKVDVPKVAEPPSRQVAEKPVAPSTSTKTTTPSSSSSTTRRLEDSKTPPNPSSAPPPKPEPKTPPRIDVPARLAAGDRALGAANLAEAKKIFRELLAAAGHDHATWIRVAEGLYRSRDFAGALSAFQHIGTLRPGEEAYRYYVAVAYYETGQYDKAKRELAAVLPYIEITPDVERYRAKIDGSR